MRGEEDVEVGVAAVFEEPIETRVGGDSVEDGEGRGCAVGGGGSVGRVVEVFVQVVVGGGGHGEGFDAEFFAGELVGVAEVD